MSSSNEQMVKSLLDEWLTTILDEADVDYMFKKGHLSPAKSARYEEPVGLKCEHFCGGPSVCEVCQEPNTVLEAPSHVKSGRFCGAPSTCDACGLPVPEARVDFPFQACCCQRFCRFKSLLFNVIGEAMIYKDEDARKTAKGLMHVRTDLLLALREVQGRLNQLQDKTD